jgi:hypothetical protein
MPIVQTLALDQYPRKLVMTIQAVSGILPHGDLAVLPVAMAHELG